MNWFDGLEAFLTVSETNNFSEAARQMGCASSVVTKRIQWLEQAMEVSLFHRTTRQVSLTESGEYLQQRVRPLMSAWHDIYRELKDFQSSPKGRLRIAFAPNLFRHQPFIDCISQFTDQYPGITLDVITVPPNTRLMENKIDILIGIDAYVGDPDVTRRVKLFDYDYGVYATKTYVSTLVEKPNVDNLGDFRCLTYRDVTTWRLGDQDIAINSFCSFDSGESLLAGCLADMGLIYYPSFMLQKSHQQDLTELFVEYQRKHETVYLYYTDVTYQSIKIRKFIDRLKQYF